MIRFFHIRAQEPHIFGRVLPKGGATVMVKGDCINPDDLIEVRHTLCSQNDMFCRKTGRSLAEKNRPVQMPLAELPTFLHRITGKVLKRAKGMGIRSEHPLMQRDYSFSMKYFTPKKEQV